MRFVYLCGQLLPENGVDAMELLSYLDTPDQSAGNSSLSTGTGVNGSTISSNSSSVNDDLLSLFET